MLAHVNKHVTLLLRGNKRRIFVLYTLSVIIILKLMTSFTSTNQHSPEQYHVTQQQFEIILKGIEADARKYPDIVRHMSRIGVIDKERTRDLTQHMRTKLSQKIWLSGNCDARWISEGVFHRGRTASVAEYVSEISTERMVFSLAHREISREVSAATESISLLSQLSADRIDLLQPLLEKWAGPINVAVYTPFADLARHHTRVARLLQKSKRKNVMVHLVQRTGELYPVNWLRNLVIKNATTKYILVSDADFIPSSNLMSQLLLEFKALERETYLKQALIVPAFETFDSDVSHLPDTKKALLKMVHDGKADVFHRKWHPAGHRIWQFDKWRHTKHGYSLEHEEICSEPEPYIAVKKSLSPYFPETLVERGKNKVAYHFEMCVLDFRFRVIGSGHLTHLPHAESAKASTAVERCVMDAWRTYRAALARQADKRHLYASIVPFQNFLYFLQALALESLWLLLLELPLLLAIVIRKVILLRTSWSEYKSGLAHSV